MTRFSALLLKHFSFVLLLCLFFFSTKIGISQDNFNEKLLGYLNFCRTKPALFADSLLVPLVRHFDGNIFTPPNYPNLEILTTEGSAPLKSLINELKKMQPSDSLFINKKVELAATELAAFQEKKGVSGHSKIDGLTMADRLLRADSKFGNFGECLSYGTNDPWLIFLQLMIDDGKPARENREILLSSDYTLIGISKRPHKKYAWVIVVNVAAY
ncbi:MAG: CAP domain-containing protein [Luteibaculaceae bacterium]